jgi:hypothetical protein
MKKQKNELSETKTFPLTAKQMVRLQTSEKSHKKKYLKKNQ